MAIQSGFYRSVGGDRKYTADFFSSYFASFIGNGVFPNPSTNLQALYFQQRTVIIKAGKAWINGHYLVNDADYGIYHDAPEPTLSRIDRIVVAANNDTREMSIYLKKGTPGVNPVAPALTRNTTVYELALADVLIPAGAVNLSQSLITDQRLNNSLCGLVHGVVQQVDTTTLFNQIQTALAEFENVQEADFLQWSADRRAEFEVWYAGVQDILDGDVASNLNNKIDALDLRVTTQLERLPVDIKSFGAIGDGVTDDTAAFRLAMTSAVDNLYISPGTYILNVTRGGNHDARDIVGNCNVINMYGVKGKSIIKLGSGNGNEANYRGFQSIFNFRSGPDLDLTVKGITFDFNYENNTPQHYQSQYSGVEINSQNFAIASVYRRDLTIIDCEFIGHSGTNVIFYRPNASNTRNAIVKINKNSFKDIGKPAKFLSGGNLVNAYHDHSTLSIHNHDEVGNKFKLISHISENDFQGAGGNAYNACECGSDIQYFHDNTIDKYYISNLILNAKKDVVVYNYKNTATNLAQAAGIFTYNFETVTPNEVGFKNLNILDNIYLINIDYHKTIPSWSSYTMGSTYYNHNYVGIFWGDRARNIDTLNIKRNTIEYLKSSDVTTIAGDTYFGGGISFAPFAPAQVAAFTTNPFLLNLNIHDNVFKGIYKRPLYYTTYPNTTNISIKGNKVFDSCFDPQTSSYAAFNIEMIGNAVGYPYQSNPIMRVNLKSLVFEDNEIFDSTISSILSVSFRDTAFNKPNSLLKYKNNTSNLNTSRSPLVISGTATLIDKIQIEDRIFDNLSDNFNLDLGTAGLTNQGGFVNVVNTQLEFTEDTNTGEHYFAKNLLITPVTGHRYYISSNVYNNNGQLVLFNRKSDNTIESSIGNAVVNTGKTSVILSVTSTSTTPQMFARFFGRAGNYPGESKKYYFKNIILVDLTEMFGLGNEPSKAWCDKYINQFTIKRNEV